MFPISWDVFLELALPKKKGKTCYRKFWVTLEDFIGDVIEAHVSSMQVLSVLMMS